MRTKLAQILTVMALIGAIGGHWAILQSVAWVSMVVNYSQEASISVAIQRTFDGRNACRLCKAVREGQSAEHKTALVKLESKLDFLMVRNTVRVDPLIVVEAVPVAFLVAPHRVDSPPTPPPRWA